ncbi:hypothetical protein [Desulforamulus ruminis]|uniref:hypothetical protein n=2 Tax=Desulforamulus ruminis TaxID=1564 RepID=UPI002354EFB0|nr:hypothetical protein [Desulforamulus ruminis]
MMKKTCALFLVLIFTLTSVTACSKRPNTSSISDKPPVSSPEAPASSQSTEDITHERSILNDVVVQRGRDGLCVGLKNDPSDRLRTIENYALVSDIERLLFLASRSGAGIHSETEKRKITKLPVIQESENTTPPNEEMWFYQGVSSKNVWMRLNYQPFIPGQGMNVWGHKDLIVYIDPDNNDNAFLGIQDASNENAWNIILLPGYGSWLAKEIDMFLYMTTAM